ncbi:MAG: phosphatidyl-myo-inositol dimannoside synthase [Blastocatellia bacterium]
MKQNRKPRLLILTSSFPGGPDDETCGYVRQFARCLSAEFKVTVLAPADRQAELISGESYRLIRSASLLPDRFNPFQSATDLNPLREANALMKLAAAIALLGFLAKALRLALQSDVICSHWLLPAGLIGAGLSRCTGKPHIAIEHSGALHLLASLRGGQWLTRFIVAGSRRVVVVSEDLRRKLIALCPEADSKCAVIPMGVAVNQAASVAQAVSLRGDSRASDTAQANSLRYIQAQTVPSLLFIGRLTKIKGVDVLLNALREIDNARLVIAGDGPERTHLEQLAAPLSINVKFVGQINAATRDALLASTDVVVIPSRLLAGQRSEGLPVVCLEAMAAGCAIIASRAGGLAEIIRDQHNGFLCEPDNAKMLAAKLQLLLNDAALRARLGQNAQRTAMAYAWPRVAERFARLINDSLDDDAIDNDTSANAERAAC